MLRHLTLFAIILSVTLSARALDLHKVRFHNEGSDTTRIVEILKDVKSQGFANTGDMIAHAGRALLGTPYVAHTLEASPGEEEMLTVNLDELDCTTFAETCMAMALTVSENRTSWRDYVYNLERIRYKGGQINGYPSRLHYIADWVVDNVYRGNVVDATNLFPKINYVVKTLDFMSRNRDRYTALADSANYEKIKQVEMGYLSHRFPYIKTRDLTDKATLAAFHNGDVVALTSTVNNLDVSHLGIVVIDRGEPYLMHASSSGGKVMITSKPLAEYMRQCRNFTGLRVIRLK